MDLFRSMAISGSALTAERLRLDVIANNLANASTTRTAASTRSVSISPRALRGSASLRLARSRTEGTGRIGEDYSPKKKELNH